MTLAWISIAALVTAVLLSCFTTINVGLLSLAMAMLVGVYLGGLPLGTVLEGFPVPLLGGGSSLARLVRPGPKNLTVVVWRSTTGSQGLGSACSS